MNKLPIKEVGPILTYQLSAAALAKNHWLCAMQSERRSDMHADGTDGRALTCFGFASSA